MNVTNLTCEFFCFDIKHQNIIYLVGKPSLVFVQEYMLYEKVKGN